jgi:hypothetical protein
MLKCNSAESQRLRLLQRLKNGPITTFQGQHEEDIPSVAPRIFELRHDFNHNIKTEYSYESRPGNGRQHRIAKYILMPGGFKEKK